MEAVRSFGVVDVSGPTDADVGAGLGGEIIEDGLQRRVFVMHGDKRGPEQNIVLDLREGGVEAGAGFLGEIARQRLAELGNNGCAHGDEARLCGGALAEIVAGHLGNEGGDGRRWRRGRLGGIGGGGRAGAQSRAIRSAVGIPRSMAGLFYAEWRDLSKAT